MSVPGIVQSTLDGEEIAARVSLGGDDELFVTPSNTLVYRSEGLLSDESVETYPHDAERLTVSEGRRKTRIALEYPLDGTREFAVPAGVAEDVLQPVLAGVLSGNEITTGGEAVIRLYRFSELSVIVTSERLLKHIGEAVWDGDYEEYRYDDVTGLSFEPGSVATQVVVEVDGRPQRIKAPNESADDLRERLQRALFEYYDVDSLQALNDRVGVEDDRPAETADPAAAFGEGVAPLDANPPTPEDNDGDVESTAAASTPSSDAANGDDPARSTGEDAGSRERARPESINATGAAASEGSGFESTAVDDANPAGSPAGSDPTAPDVTALVDRLDALEATVERQTALLERQQATIEQLIEELRQGR